MSENKLIKTEKEAIECLKKNKPKSGFYMLQEAVDMAIYSLEEIQQYRALGTVEELVNKDVKAMVDRTELALYKELGTVEELRVARDKQIAKKAEWKFDDFTATFGNPYRCTNCDEEFGDTYNYCPNCGCDMYAD